MLNRSLRIDGAAPSVSNRRAAGFSLVEALIALALGTWLVSAVGLTAQRLSLMARLSSDEVELAERGDFALRHLSQALLGASPITEASIDVTPCGVFQPRRQRLGALEGGVGIRVVKQGHFSCLPSQNLVRNSPLLIVEEANLGLEAGCEEHLSSSGWLEEPARDSALESAKAKFNWMGIQVVPEHCPTVTESVAVRSKRLYYLRDFAWDDGDGVGALMMKVWKPERQGFGRAEVLVPGVINWIIEPVELPIESLSGEARQLMSGVEISLILSSLRSGLSGPVSPQLGYHALTRASSQRMVLKALVLSRNLRAPEFHRQFL
jgi:hypothetical protein